MRSAPSPVPDRPFEASVTQERPCAPSLVFWAAASALTVFAYCASLAFLFPGYFGPLAPFDVDFYVYAAAASKTFTALLTRFPRPVAYVVCKIISSAGVRPMMAAGIAIVLANVLLTVWLIVRVLRLSARSMLLPCAFYAVLLFAHPQFYVEHRHDLPAEISWFFLSIGLLAWLRASELPRMRRAPLIAALSCMVLFAFAKEIYFVSALFILIGLALAQPARRLRHLSFAAFTAAAEFASARWTNHFKGPFVNTAADPTATYYINISPVSVAHTFNFYLQQLLNPLLVALVVLALLLAWRDRSRFILSGTFVLAGLAAFATLSVIPNHKYEEYAWAAAPFFLAPVFLFGQPEVLRGIWPRRLSLLAFATLAIATIAAPVGYRGVYPLDTQLWWLDRERMGNRIEDSLAQYENLPPRSRVLVAGLQNSSVPWQVEDYLAVDFPDLAWTVVLPPDETYRKNSRFAAFVDPRQVDLSRSDYIASYRGDGQFLSIRRIASIPEGADINRTLVPDFDIYAAQAQKNPKDPAPLLAAAAIAEKWQMWREAVQFLSGAYRRAPDPESEETFADLARPLPAEFRQAYEAALPARTQVPVALFHRPELTANPAHVKSTDGTGVVQTDLVWKVRPEVKIELHLNSPTGTLFASGLGPGHSQTGKWVKNGMSFFLQDVTGNKPLKIENTIAVAKVEVE